jgi:hypothetical protein
MGKCSPECQCNSEPIIVTDNMGREVFWEDIGREND